jgi:hypothetical protein
MNKYTTKSKVISWLLEEDNPPVRFLTLRHLLGDPGEAEQVKPHLMKYTVTQTILNHMDQILADEDSRAYWKYKGKYWQLIFLGQFLADGGDPAVSRIADNILKSRKWIWKAGGQCLAANILAALMRLGYRNRGEVGEETETLAKQVIKHSGLQCEAMGYSLLSHCYMAIPKVLLCFSEIPPAERSRNVSQAIEILMQILINHRIYVYVPGNKGQWQAILETAPKAAELPKGQTVKAWIEKEKNKFLESHGQGTPVEKMGWKKFGFPLHYNSDILEAMWALAKLNIPLQPALNPALDIIQQKMIPGGKWILENSLNGKMWADVESKGKPSKWITYIALHVLNHFYPGNPSLFPKS